MLQVSSTRSTLQRALARNYSSWIPCAVTEFSTRITYSTITKDPKRHLSQVLRKSGNLDFPSQRGLRDGACVHSSRSLSSTAESIVPPTQDDDETSTLAFEDESIYPWKNILQTSARATWRVSDTELPAQIQETLDQIFVDGKRTNRQLKRTYERVMETQQKLVRFRERERRSMVNENSSDGRKGKAAQYDIEKNPPVFYGPDQALANVKFRFQANYAISKRVLMEVKSLLGHDKFRPQRVLDFGIGGGSASAAALEVFPNTIDWVHGIEPSHSMREHSEQILSAASKKSPTDESNLRVTYSSSLSAESSGSGGFDLILAAYTASEVPQVSANLAASAILFQKLNPNGILVFIEPGTPDGFNSVRAARNMLLDCCPPEDPEFEWDERCHVLAPCTHNGPCPMERHKKNFIKPNKILQAGSRDIIQPFHKEGEDISNDPSDYIDGDESDDDDSDDGLTGWEVDEDDTITDAEYVDLSASSLGIMSQTDQYNSSFCSFVQTMPGAKRSRGEKFSYLVVQKRLASEYQHSKQPDDRLHVSKLLANLHQAGKDQNIPNLEKYYADAKELESKYLNAEDDDLGLELLDGDTNRSSFGRIIRAPLKKRGHVYIDYCAGPGRIVRNRVTKSMNNYAPGIFPAARKSRWGGYWPDTMEKVYAKEDSNKEN